MDKSDEIVITSLLKRFADNRLPRALEIEKRVEAGEKLNGANLQSLENVFNDAQYVLPYAEKYPEYREYVTKTIEIYKNIVQKGLANEKNKPSK